MNNELIEMMNQGQYEKVLAELDQYGMRDYIEKLVIIAVSSLLEKQDYEKAREYLQLGLQTSGKSSKLYFLLGNYYERYNSMQAYLSYENAEFYCNDVEDKEIIREIRKKIVEKYGIKDRKISIILLSKGSQNKVKLCIESIHNNLPFSFEIIVVNCLEDESLEWPQQCENVKFIKNSGHVEKTYAYNQGMEAADPESDILLLDSDAVLDSNALFWLKMGLYDNDRIGAAGSQECDEPEQKSNVSLKNFCETKFYLGKSALLIRREVINEIGLLDTNFKQENFCYKDLGLRVCQTSWRNVLCHNSHISYSGMEKDDDCSVKENPDFIEEDKSKFREKWNFNIFNNGDSEKKIIGLMDGEKERDIRVLEVGCGLGELLAKIQFEYPHSQVYGVEFQPEIAEIGSWVLNIVHSDIEKFYIPFGNIKFDYIILADTLGYFHNPDKILKKLKNRLRAGGSFLCRIPNFMHVSVVHQLLLGEFEYQDQGILDEKYFKFFTLNSIRRLFEKCGIYIDKLKYTENITAGGGYNREFSENINRIIEGVDKQQLLAYQYVFRAKASVPKKEFRITAVGMIKNAADVIETYIRANGLIVDNFVLLDNMCSDRTIFILDELKKEGFDIEIINDDMIEYKQSEKMNKLIYYVNKKYHSDFIIPIDDDECVVPFTENYTVEDVRELIEKLPQNKLYYLKWRTYIPSEEDNECMLCVAQRQKYCYGDESKSLDKIIIPRGILEDETFEIEIGNHSGKGKLISGHELLPFACMAHFPCRSEAQVRSKALTGWTNFLTSPDRKDGEGLQWEMMYAAAKKGEKISLRQMQEMASLYVPNCESVPVNRRPVNLPEEAMLIKYTRTDEVNPWENYCLNVEVLAQKYVELLKGKYI